MIKKLTTDQKKQLKVYKDKWMSIGMSCEPMNFEYAKDAIVKAHEVVGLTALTKFIRCGSPNDGRIRFGDLDVDGSTGSSLFGGLLVLISPFFDVLRTQVSEDVISIVRDELNDPICSVVWDGIRGRIIHTTTIWNNISDVFYESHEAALLGYYDYFANVCGVKELLVLQPFMNIAKSCGWITIYKGTVYIQDRPQSMKFDKHGQLRNGRKSPAIQYRDGYSIYINSNAPTQ